MSEFNADLSSEERAKVGKLVESIVVLLRQAKVQKVLSQCNKAEILIKVQDGVAVEVTPAPAMRRGKELPE